MKKPYKDRDKKMRALKSTNTNIAVLRGSTPVKGLRMVLPEPLARKSQHCYVMSLYAGN